MTKKRKHADKEEGGDHQSSKKELGQQGAVGDANAFKNKEKVLILSTRGITFR